MQDLKGLATGIGSLPHKEVEAALDLIFKHCPEIPFWPQLPKRDIREGMVAQFSEGLPCIEVRNAGIIFNAADKEKKLERFYEKIINRDLEYFKISQDFAGGLYAFKKRLQRIDKRQIRRIKCHITGPFTLAASLKDEKEASLLHNPVFMQAIIKGLAMKALWQIRFLEEFGKVIIFIDEPYLGCFGSAYTPVNREDVVRALKELTENIRSAGTVQVGVHCCGNTDWSIFTDINSIDIISFDAFGFLDKLVLYADGLKKFFAQDRMLCWGIIPTQELSEQITPEALVEKINKGIEVLVKKGIERAKLNENLLLSPSCGLGSLDPTKAEEIFRLLASTSSFVKKP